MDAVREILGLEPLATKRKTQDQNQDVLLTERDEGESYANPVPQPLGWIIGGAIFVGAAAWWWFKKKTPTWSCQKGHDCINYNGTKTWRDDDPVSKALKIYDTPPTNLAQLEVKRTEPDYKVYALAGPKQGVGMCWLP